MLGVADTIKQLRTKYGIKIGSSTGYTSEIMAKLKVGTFIDLITIYHLEGFTARNEFSLQHCTQ